MTNIFENDYLNYERKKVKKNQFQIKMQAKPTKQWYIRESIFDNIFCAYLGRFVGFLFEILA